MEPQKNLLSLMRRSARPVKWAMCVVLFVGLLETFIVARNGNSAVLQYSVVLTLLLFIEAFSYAFGAAAASLFARQVSSNAQKNIALLATSTTFVAGIAIAFTASLVIALYEQNFALAGMNRFMQTFGPIIPLIMVNHIGFALLRANHQSHRCAEVLIAAAVVHACSLTILSTDVLMPSWGIMGVASAYVVSTLSATFSLAYIISRQVNNWRFHDIFQNVHVFFRELVPIVSYAATSNLMTPLLVVMVMALLSRESDAHLVAYTIVLKIEMFAVVGFYALSSVIGPIAGRFSVLNAGSSMYHAVSSCLVFCLKQGLVIAVLLGVIQLLFGIDFLRCCDESIQLLKAYLLIVPLSYGTYGVVMLVNAIANGIGHPSIGLITSFFRAIGFFVPLAFLLSFFSLGIFVAIALTNIFSGLLAVHLLRRKLRTTTTQFSLLI